jgi:single-strand DNA-binding protein
MAGWQQIIIIGNVGRKEELRYLQSGVPVLNFTVAVTTRSGQGENRQEKTTWFRIAAWRQLGETLNQYIEKGKQVMVTGTLDSRIYTDNAGQPAISLEITARDIQLLGSRQDAGQGGQGDYQQYGQEYAPPAPDSMGDIPF